MLFSLQRASIISSVALFLSIIAATAVLLNPQYARADSPTVTFSASPTAVASGQSSTLSLTTSNVASCAIFGGIYSDSQGNGQTITSPASWSGWSGAITASTVFTVYCSGNDNNLYTRTATVDVGSAPVSQPTVTLSASPTTVSSGFASTLDSYAQGMRTCTIAGGWYNGSYIDTTHWQGSSGNLTQNTTFTVTCVGNNGASYSASATVYVGQAPAGGTPSITLSATPTSLAAGASGTLNLAAFNMNTCAIYGGTYGSGQNLASSALQNWSGTTGYLTSNTTFTVTCSGLDNKSYSKTVTVAVGTQPTVSATPVVTLTASPASVSALSASTLKLSSQHMTSCKIAGGIYGSGQVIAADAVSAWSGTSGVVSQSTTYTATCTGDDNKSYSATATVSVQGVTTTSTPTVTLLSSATTVNAGQSASLTLSTSNVATCAIYGGTYEPGQNIPTPSSWSGTTGNLTRTTTFSAICSGNDNKLYTREVTVTVPGSTPTDPNVCTVLSLSADLEPGDSGASVRSLQEFLARDNSVYPEAIVNGNYGPLTVSAVQRWQSKFNILSSGTPESNGYGAIGPRTRAALSQCPHRPTVTPDTTTTPTISLTSSAAGVISGGSTTLTLTTTNMATCAIYGGIYDPGQNITTPASWSGYTGILTVGTTFKAICSGNNNQLYTKTVAVSVALTTTPNPTDPGTCSATGSSSALRFTRAIGIGASGADVSAIQRALAADASIYPSGIVSGYFGALTQQAVKRYQQAHGIVSSGTPQSTGFGLVGPTTFASIISSDPCTPTPDPTSPIQISVNPATITDGGGGTISVTANNMQSCAISGGIYGDTAPGQTLTSLPTWSGSTGTMTHDTTYVVKCSDSSGATKTNSLFVDVVTPTYGVSTPQPTYSSNTDQLAVYQGQLASLGTTPLEVANRLSAYNIVVLSHVNSLPTVGWASNGCFDHIYGNPGDMAKLVKALHTLHPGILVFGYVASGADAPSGCGNLPITGGWECPATGCVNFNSWVDAWVASGAQDSQARVDGIMVDNVSPLLMSASTRDKEFAYVKSKNFKLMPNTFAPGENLTFAAASPSMGSGDYSLVEAFHITAGSVNIYGQGVMDAWKAAYDQKGIKLAVLANEANATTFNQTVNCSNVNAKAAYNLFKSKPLAGNAFGYQFADYGLYSGQINQCDHTAW